MKKSNKNNPLQNVIYLNTENASSISQKDAIVVPHFDYYMRELSRSSPLQVMLKKLKAVSIGKLLKTAAEAIVLSPNAVISPISYFVYMFLYFELSMLNFKPSTVIIDEKIVDLFVLNENPQLFIFLTKRFRKKGIALLLKTMNKEFILSKYSQLFKEDKNTSLDNVISAIN